MLVVTQRSAVVFFREEGVFDWPRGDALRHGRRRQRIIVPVTYQQQQDCQFVTYQQQQDYCSVTYQQLEYHSIETLALARVWREKHVRYFRDTLRYLTLWSLGYRPRSTWFCSDRTPRFGLPSTSRQAGTSTPHIRCYPHHVSQEYLYIAGMYYVRGVIPGLLLWSIAVVSNRNRRWRCDMGWEPGVAWPRGNATR